MVQIPLLCLSLIPFTNNSEDDMSATETIGPTPWYSSLTSTQWKALIASNLGWTFDGFEVFALILTVGVALHQLLDPSQYAQIPAYAGTVIAITVFGWAIGGMLGGIIADYLGRKRAMTYTILAYSLLTGLSAFAWDWTSFAVLRFLVGLAIGSEWATGASITSEIWPAEQRGKGGAFLQAGFPLGSIIASTTWLMIGTSSPGAWRYMFLVGVLPALLVLWIRRNIPESPRWTASNIKRRESQWKLARGLQLSPEDFAHTRFTLVDMFTDASVRPRLILAFLMSLSVTIGYWGVSSFVPSYVGAMATASGLPAQSWVAMAGLTQNVSALFGCFAFGFLADNYGRRWVTFAFYLACLVMTPIVYMWVKDIYVLLLILAVYGFVIQGVFAWMPVWLPELFPTRMRGTAASFVFNAPRFISGFAPLIAGTLIVGLGGYGQAATIIGMFYALGLIAVMFLPETKGEGLV
jgi:MFS family permease